MKFKINYSYVDDLSREGIESSNIIHNPKDEVISKEEALEILRKKEISKAVESMLDMKAQDYGYESMQSARSYASLGMNLTNPFKKEALKLANYSISCWNKVSQLEKEYQQNKRISLRVDEVIKELEKLS